MKEQLISFETAKLLREKGFGGPGYTTEYSYQCIPGGNYFLSQTPQNNQSKFDGTIGLYPGGYPGYSAITQSVCQKWLRKEHNIEFVIKPFHDSSIHKTTYVADPIHIPTGRTSRIARQDSYEEALEKGLQEALNLI